MAKKPRAAGKLPNDDIGQATRLALYRSQQVLRVAEQRAFDLFLQNLVKGTSHLSLGQEAIAAGFALAMQPGDLSFCTYRGHAHTLARGVPVEKVLGEIMQRDNGLIPNPKSSGSCIMPLASAPPTLAAVTPNG